MCLASFCLLVTCGCLDRVQTNSRAVRYSACLHMLCYSFVIYLGVFSVCFVVFVAINVQHVVLFPAQVPHLTTCFICGMPQKMVVIPFCVECRAEV